MRRLLGVSRGREPTTNLPWVTWSTWTHGICLHPPPKTFRRKAMGPFPILSQVGSGSFKLGVPAYWGIFDTFHHSLLKPSLPIFTQVPSSGPSETSETEAPDVPPGGEHNESAPDTEEQGDALPDLEESSGEELEPQPARRPRRRYAPLPFPSISSRTRSRTT